MGMEVISAITALVGAVAGGLITGYFTLKSVKETFKKQRSQNEEQEGMLVNCLLQGLYDELEIVLEGYQRELGPTLSGLEEGKAVMSFFPLIGDYFPIYNGNTLVIGKVRDNHLRKRIIRTYHLGKSMIDSIRFNNELLRKYEYTQKLFEETGEVIHQKQTEVHMNSLIEYGQTLKQIHVDLMTSLSDTMKLLTNNIDHRK